MTNVTCGLTAKKPGSVPFPTVVIDYFTFLHFTSCTTFQWATWVRSYNVDHITLLVYNNQIVRVVFCSARHKTHAITIVILTIRLSPW